MADSKILGAGEITLITNTVYGAGFGTSVSISHALKNSPLGEFFLYGISSDLTTNEINDKVIVKFFDTNNILLSSYEMPLSWIGYEYDETIEDRAEVKKNITLKSYAKVQSPETFEDYYVDEWQVIEGILNYYTTTEPHTQQIEYLNANDPEHTDELNSDQKRVYIENWNQIIVPAEECTMQIYTTTNKLIYFSIKWITNTNANSETAAKVIKTDNEQKINNYLLDRAIDINREEGKIQVGVDTREHLVIKNDGVTISQGEEMESQFTGKYVQLGKYKIIASYSGIAFVLKDYSGA